MGRLLITRDGTRTDLNPELSWKITCLNAEDQKLVQSSTFQQDDDPKHLDWSTMECVERSRVQNLSPTVVWPKTCRSQMLSIQSEWDAAGLPRRMHQILPKYLVCADNIHIGVYIQYILCVTIRLYYVYKYKYISWWIYMQYTMCIYIFMMLKCDVNIHKVHDVYKHTYSLNILCICIYSILYCVYK